VYCNSCGHKNPIGANFCSSCGAVLETAAAEPTTITFFPTVPSDPSDDDVAVELDDAGPLAVLVVTRGPNAGSRFALDGELVTIGRHPQSDIFLDDITVSRRHVELRAADETWTAHDAGSLNGTYVNRERIDHALLSDGDELQVGKFKLHFVQGTGGG
jgi:pSer/pThr/pTyr-binding forkhead associated (FHA) protein